MLTFCWLTFITTTNVLTDMLLIVSLSFVAYIRRCCLDFVVCYNQDESTMRITMIFGPQGPLYTQSVMEHFLEALMTDLQLPIESVKLAQSSSSSLFLHQCFFLIA